MAIYGILGGEERIKPFAAANSWFPIFCNLHFDL